jgi:long-chain acyl-CoA synthetase
MTWLPPADWEAHRGSVGRAVLGELHIVGDNGEEVPPGEVGTVYFSGGPKFEYHADPAETAAASRNAKGWTTVGDLGRVDRDGFLYLADRKGFMIISGGVNIYPQEIENVLASHPKVQAVAVFGVPNEEFGEEVKAVVQPTDPTTAGPELARELIAWCRSHLAHYKCPPVDRLRGRAPAPHDRQAPQAAAARSLLARANRQSLTRAVRLRARAEGSSLAGRSVLRASRR